MAIDARLEKDALDAQLAWFARHPLLFFLSCVAAFAAFGLFAGTLHPWPFSSNDDPPKINDLLVTAIAISGVTVPVLITYLSLGRLADVLSEIGDAVPFFMSKHGLKKDSLNAALDMARVWHIQKKPPPSEEVYCIRAVKELNELGMASGDFLRRQTKLALVPPSHHRRFDAHLQSGHDRRFLRWFAEVVGVSAILCVICLYSGHFGDDGPRQERLHQMFFWTEHALCTFTFVSNIAAYIYLVRVTRIRAVVQATAFKNAEQLCKNAASYYANWKERSDAERAEALKTAKAETTRMNKTPPNPPSGKDGVSGEPTNDASGSSVARDRPPSGAKSSHALADPPAETSSASVSLSIDGVPPSAVSGTVDVPSDADARASFAETDTPPEGSRVSETSTATAATSDVAPKRSDIEEPSSTEAAKSDGKSDGSNASIDSPTQVDGAAEGTDKPTKG